MKKFLPLTLFFVLINIYGQKDGLVTDKFNYKIIYDLTYQPDSTNVESKKNEDMYLYLGDEVSRFSSARKVEGDSLKKAFYQRDFNQADFINMRKQISKTAFEYYIYKGIPTEKMTYTREILMDKYRYTEDKELFNWTILEETDSIAGFRVQKATTSFAGRNYTAWFSEEIPFPEGPYKFHGLPGLIMKIGDDKGHYLFELTQIKKLGKSISFTFDEEEYLDTERKKLLKLELEYKKDPVSFAERSVPGVKIEYESEKDKNRIERERKEKLKRQNNPIELE